MPRDHVPVDGQALSRARDLRREMSPAEKKLWARLRGGQFPFKFRRQHPIAPYIADFYCHSCRLVVELDGDSHSERVAHDEARTKFFEANGYEVLRFENPDVFERTDAVLEEIL